jgi:hypothetical protein
VRWAQWEKVVCLRTTTAAAAAAAAAAAGFIKPHQWEQSSSKFYSTIRNLNLLLFTFFILVTQHVSAYLQAIFRRDL